MRALILTLLLTPAPALAQVPPPAAGSCAIRSPGINFGLYSALDQSANTALGRIDVVCAPGVGVGVLRVTLSPGRSAQALDRTMGRGDAHLRYNLYADPSYQRVLGDGSSGTVTLVQRNRALGRASFRIYARIWPRQSVPAGEYSDNVRIVVEF